MQNAFGQRDWIVNRLLLSAYHPAPAMVDPRGLLVGLLLAYPAGHFSQLGWASGVFETYFAARDAYEIMTASDQIMTASSPDSRACQSLRRLGGGCRTRSYQSRLA